MKVLTRLVLCCLLAGVGIQAQRGGGVGRGGFGGGGFRGAGFGGYRGGMGGSYGGFGGYRGGFVNRGFGGRGYIGHGYWGWNRWGWGGRSAYYWPGYYYPSYSNYSNYPYYPYAYSGYPTDYGYSYGYGSSPNVVVVYPQPQPAAAPAYYQQPSPVIREYDENGYEVTPSRSARSGSPTYLIALKNHVIYDAVSYSIRGDTIYFVTVANEQKSSPLIMVDRAFSMQLNNERGVNFQLP